MWCSSAACLSLLVLWPQLVLAGSPGDRGTDVATTRLRLDLQELKKSNVFKPGQLVRWKSGLKNKSLPEPEQPAIVVEVLPQPVFGSESGSGSPYFREPLDLILGFIDEDDEFLCYHFDQRRFAPVADKSASGPEASRLQAALTLLRTSHRFQPGQLVRWKAGLKHQKTPSEEESAIVVEVLAKPVFDSEKDAGSQYFREPLDLVLGVIDEEGDFLLYHYDGRRFEPVTGNASSPRSSDALIAKCRAGDGKACGDYLRGMIKEGRHQGKDEGSRIAQLTASGKALLQTHRFMPGSLVRWKSGLRNRTRPEYDEPAVVVEVLDRPVLDKETDSGSPYFQEPLDLLLGIIDEEGDFVIFHYDRRRFEPFPAGTLL